MVSCMRHTWCPSNGMPSMHAHSMAMQPSCNACFICGARQGELPSLGEVLCDKARLGDMLSKAHCVPSQLTAARHRHFHNVTTVRDPAQQLNTPEPEAKHLILSFRSTTSLGARSSRPISNMLRSAMTTTSPWMSGEQCCLGDSGGFGCQVVVVGGDGSGLPGERGWCRVNSFPALQLW